MYDPQLGRWNVVDPLAEKYPSMSPYVAMANNPVMFVDPDGRENINYLINLPSSNLTTAELTSLSNALNNKMKDYGVDIQFVVYNGKLNDFYKSDVDDNDAFTLFGSPEDVSGFAEKNLGRLGFAFGDGGLYNAGWTNGAISGIDAVGMKELAKYHNATFLSVAVYLVLHERGHTTRDIYGLASSKKHTYGKNNVLLWEGNKSKSALDKGTEFKTFDDFMKKEYNSEYINNLKIYFNGKSSKDNRESNRSFRNLMYHTKEQPKY